MSSINVSKQKLLNQIDLIKTRIKTTTSQTQKHKLYAILKSKKEKLHQLQSEKKNEQLQDEVFGTVISSEDEEEEELTKIPPSVASSGVPLPEETRDGYRLYKYQRFKTLLVENKSVSSLFSPDSYNLENFKKGIIYIDSQKLYPKIIESSDKKESKTSLRNKKMLMLVYIRFKTNASRQIINEWDAFSISKKEAYNRQAEQLLLKKKTRVKRLEKKLDKFSSSFYTMLDEQKAHIAKKIPRKEYIELLKQSKAQPKNKVLKKELSVQKKEREMNRKKAIVFQNTLSQFRLKLKKDILPQFSKYSDNDQKRIKTLSKTLNIEENENKDQTEINKWESEYQKIQKKIQQTLSEQQKYITENKTKLTELLYKSDQKLDEYNNLLSKKHDMKPYQGEEYKKYKKKIQLVTSQYKQLQRQKETLQQKVNNQLHLIETKTGLLKEKEKLEKELQPYYKKHEKSTKTLEKLNQNIKEINALKKKITKLDDVINSMKSDPTQLSSKLPEGERYMSLINERKSLFKNIETLKKENISIKNSDAYNFYWFYSASKTFKWIKKIKILFVVYDKQLNVFKSFSTLKPKYIDFKPIDLVLKTPARSLLPKFQKKTITDLYLQLFESSNPFLKKLAAYLPDDYTTNPPQCKKILAKVGAKILKNNGNIPTLNTDCNFLYINKTKKKVVNNIIYYEVVDKNTQFISEDGILNQCSDICPTKQCKDYMPSSNHTYKCIDNHCVYRNKNNDEHEYIKIIKSYREGILNELTTLFKTKLGVTYPQNNIYASNVEKYYYVNSINLLTYLFNISLIFTLLSIKINPNCVNHIVITLNNLFKENNYKSLPLNFKDLSKFICNDTLYTSHDEKTLIQILFLNKFKIQLNFQLNTLYLIFNAVSKRGRDYVDSSPLTVTIYNMWQDILITTQYAPVNNKKFKEYKEFLKNLHMLIQSDVKKLESIKKRSKSIIKKTRAKRDEQKFLNSFLAESSSLTRIILETISESNYNPYFKNLLQLTISNFILYYKSISSLKTNTPELFTKLQTSLKNTLHQDPNHKKNMKNIREQIVNSMLTQKLKNESSWEENIPSIISKIDLEKDIDEPILWSKSYCNQLCSKLDEFIQLDIKPQYPKEPKKEIKKNLKEEPKEEPKEEKESWADIMDREQPIPKPESNHFKFDTPPSSECFQCKKNIKNKKLNTVHLKTNKPISFCGFNCFGMYSD